MIQVDSLLPLVGLKQIMCTFTLYHFTHVTTAVITLAEHLFGLFKFTLMCQQPRLSELLAEEPSVKIILC